MEFILKFKNYLLSQNNGASKATVKNYLADVKQFIAWVESTYKKTFIPTETNIQIINEFKLQKSKELSASSVDRHISSLRKFFTFLKLEGEISQSPFDLSASNFHHTAPDPWHLHDFKNYLYVYNASNLTIKNYIIDIKQFLSWAEQVLNVQDAWNVVDKNVLARIDNKLVEEYKNRLLTQHVFSPTSINRKLSSLRKYLGWAAEQGYLNQEVGIMNYELSKRVTKSFVDETNSKSTGNNFFAGSEQQRDRLLDKRNSSELRTQEKIHSQAESEKLTNSIQSQKPYSNIPPIRLFQKLTKASTWTFDLLITAPIAHAFRKIEHTHWKLKGKPIFKKASSINNLSHVQNTSFRPSFKPQIPNISKELYAPLSVSIKDFPFYKKVLFHIRHTRPNWYHRYHQLAIAHYFNWAVLIIFATAIGFGMYNSFVEKPGKSLAALPTQPIRVLSFQGRLTDANNNPITSTTWIRFEIYNNQSSSASARLWEEADKVTPDQDGIFSLLLGSSGASDGSAASLCNSGSPPTSPATGACGIPSTLFADNNALWLGVTVEATGELTPREQLATVAYASNSETLQGLPPITAAGAGTNNVVLALNSSGNLSIGASTTFQSSSGTFTLSGNTLTLNTNSGTNGNISLAPDGLGTIDFQRPLQTSTNNGDVASAPNALTIEDIAAILATSSGQSALTINQNGTGPIISASASGNAKFTVDNSGNTTANTFYTGLGTTYYINNTTSNLNSLTLAGNLTVSGNVASNLTPDGNGTRSLGDATHQWFNIYGENIYSNGQLLTSYWNENLGALSPIHTRDDLILGGTATSDAKFQVYGTSGNTYIGGTLGVGTTSPLATIDLRGASGTTAVASVSGQTSFAGLLVDNKGTGDLFTASTSGLPKFTILNSGSIKDSNYTTANGILFADSTGLFTQTAQGAAHTLLHGNGSSAPTFSAVDLTADVTNALGVSNGGLGANLSAGAAIGDILYADSTTTFKRLADVGVGSCLISGGAGAAPSWGSCGSGSGNNWWTLDSTHGDLYPVNTTLDLLAGGTATNSAKFAVTGIAGALTPFASVSATVTSGGNGSGVTIGGDGSIQSLENKNLTIGGNTTGDIILKPANGATNGHLQITYAGTGVLHSDVNGFITSSTVNLANGSSDITGTLSTANGGTGLATGSLSSGDILYYSGGNAYTNLAKGADNTILNIDATTHLPVWTASPTLTNLTVNTTATLNQIAAVSNNKIIPSTNGTLDLGDSTHYFNNIYVNNISTPVGNGTSGFWTVTNTTNLYPANQADDLLIGGTGTNSASFQVFAQTVGVNTAGTATTSGNITFRGTAGSQTAFGLNLLNGSSLAIKRSVGGDAGLTSVLTIGNDGNITDAGNLAVNGSSLTSTDTGSFALLNTNITTLNFGASVTTANVVTSATTLHLADGAVSNTVSIGGTSGGTTTINNNLAVTGTFNLTGNLTSSIIPDATSRNLGSSSNFFGSVYANNFLSPIGQNGIAGYWQLTAGVLSPANIQNDFAVGGNATASATPFEVFANSYTNDQGTVKSGTATTSGNLVFRAASGTNIGIQYLNGSDFVFQRSPGGDKGLATVLTLGNDGNITDAGNLAVNGSSLTSTTSSFSLLNSGVTTLNFANAATTVHFADNSITNTLSIGGNAGTTTVNNALTATGTLTANGNVVLGASSSNTINTNGDFISDLIPNAADTYNLGNPTHEWNTLYIKQIVSPSSGGVAGFWQLNSGVLAPVNVSNDLFIGSNNPAQIPATSSAFFQVFGASYTTDASINSGTIPGGTASTSGNLTFKGTVGSQTVFQTNLLNGSNLGFYSSVGGDKGITNTTPELYLANSGNVGVGTNTPGAALTVYKTGAGNSEIKVDSDSNYAKFAGYYQGTKEFEIEGESTGNAYLNTRSDLYLRPGNLGSSGNVIIPSGSVGIGTTNPLSKTGLDVEKDSLGNALSIFKQLSTDSNADLITASNSAGTTQLQITNTGNLYARKFTDLDNSIYYIDPAGLTVSASVAGSMTFTPASEHDINFLNNSDINFKSSPGGDAGLTSRLFLQGSTGYVGIGTSTPSANLTITGSSNDFGNDALRVYDNTMSGYMFSQYISTGVTTPYVRLGSYSSSKNSFENFVINDGGGNVGIKETNPQNPLDVNGSVAIGTYAGTTVGTSNSLIVSGDIGIGRTNPAHALDVYGTGDVYIQASVPQLFMYDGNGSHGEGELKWDSTNSKFLFEKTSAGTNAFSFNTTNGTGIARVAWTTGTPDIAENVHNFDGANAGDILVSDPTASESGKKTATPYDPTLIGAVSTRPGFLMTGDIHVDNITDAVELTPHGFVPLVLAGRVPTKVSTKNGIVKIGDKITSSTLSGIGMKATQPGTVVGIALDNFEPSKMTCTQVSSLDAINWPNDPNGFNQTATCYELPNGTYVGKIMVLIKPEYYNPDTLLTSIQGFKLNIQNGITTITSNTGEVIQKIGVYSQAMIGTLTAGIINTQQLATNSLAVTTGNVSIAGQQLRDYIVSVVNNAINNGTIGQLSNKSITSPLAEVDQLHTNLISPLASNSAIAVDLSNNSRLDIKNTFSQKTVASIDNSGNATFSGKLNSQNLAVNGDATVSGTLHANKIEANEIAGLSEVVSTLSAQNITNINNIFFATPSSVENSNVIATGSNTNSSSSSGLLTQTGNFANIASFSAYFAYVPNLNATTGLFNQGLVSLGPTSLADTTINGQLSINGNLILADNSINVLGADFAIQPLRQGGINFEGGLIAIDTNGNLTVNGKATFNGGVYANVISPIGNSDVTIRLGDSYQTSNNNYPSSGTKNSQLNIQNASGSAIFAVNQLGDLVASGTATIGKLNLNLVSPALALSDTEVVATGSAGTTAIKAHQKEITIDNPNVTSKSLIYITPVGTDQTPYLERQASGTSFTVGIPTAQPNEVNFNWLIVN